MHGTVRTDARAERIGRTIANIFIVALFAMFAYGYVGPLLFR